MEYFIKKNNGGLADLSWFWKCLHDLMLTKKT